MASFPPIRGDEVAAWGGAVPKTQTTSVKTLKTGCCGRGGLCFGRTGAVGFSGSLLGVCSGDGGFNVATLSRSGPGGWVYLLATLTHRCAAKPHWWHGGQPAQTTTCRVNVRVGGLR